MLINYGGDNCQSQLRCEARDQGTPPSPAGEHSHSAGGLIVTMATRAGKTKVAEDYAKFYNHGLGPIPYDHCFGIPISCLLTVDVGSTSI